jgi:hypothetical protein
MKKDLVSRVLSIVILAGILGWFMFDQQVLDIQNMQSMTVAEVAQKAMTPSLATRTESVGLFIAFGVTIVILTELLGFFIRIIFFRRLEETNIIHNHNITLQLSDIDSIKKRQRKVIPDESSS